ncbi:MAG TPA: hypothetical protein VGG33_09725 [Polyangia bacterium]
MNSDSNRDDGQRASETQASHRPRAPLPWLGDFFLRDHEAEVRRIPADTRATLARRTDVATQRLQSAHILWASEQTAEALRLGEAALEEALQVAELAAALHTRRAPESLAAGATDFAARATRALADLGVDAGTRVEVETTGLGGRLPERNQDLGPADRRRFSAITRTAALLLEAARPLAHSPKDVKLRRLGRIATLALATLAVVLGLQRWFAVDERFTITASGSYDPSKFGPDKAADRDPKTEWLLPSRAPGWVDVKFSRRDLRQVTVRNAQNPPFADRGTRNFRLELYREANLVHSSKHAFTSLDGEPQTLTLPIEGDEVDGLRIVVDEYHKAGGGLSELSWR